MIRKPLLAMFATCLLMGSGLLRAADAPAPAAAPAATEAPAVAPTIAVDKTSLDNGGVITVTGTAAPGKPVFLEIYNENKVGGSYFDKAPDKETGKAPNKLYLAKGIPAFFRIYVPTTAQPVLDKYKKDGRGWAYSGAMKELGADIAYSAPAKDEIDSYQATLTSIMTGSRGEQLPQLDDKERKRRSMQIVKARFRSVDKLLVAGVEQQADGSFTAKVKIPDSMAPGKYFITAVTDKNAKSAPVSVENKIGFPIRYMSNAGTSINLFYPFGIVLALATFGVLMGAGGGFIINPILLMFFPIPHNVVAGTVTPTVLFSQASGVTNYARIKFISWKVGIIMGLAMVGGALIGPALTQLITLDEFKSAFGYVLFFLAALMFWQTTPGYLAKNKKEQAILKEFQKRAAQAGGAKA